MFIVFGKRWNVIVVVTFAKYMTIDRQLLQGNGIINYMLSLAAAASILWDALRPEYDFVYDSHP